MSGGAVIGALRALCRALDEGAPVERVAWPRRIAVVAVPAAIGLCGCAATDPAPRERPEPAARADGGPWRSDAAAGTARPEAASTFEEGPGRPADAGIPEPRVIPPDAGPARAEEPDGQAVQIDHEAPTSDRAASDPPAIRLGEVEVLYGSPFSPEVVRRVVRGARDEIRACAESHPGSALAEEQRVVLEWTIEADGHVTGARPRPDGEAELGACLAGVVSRLTFPRRLDGGGTVNVVYPLVIRR